jgi:hypothetical protein
MKTKYKLKKLEKDSFCGFVLSSFVWFWFELIIDCIYVDLQVRQNSWETAGSGKGKYKVILRTQSCSDHCEKKKF